MKEDSIIVTLLKIWPELPVLAGEQWTVMEPRLRALLADYEADSRQVGHISHQIQDILESVPAVIARFDELLEQIDAWSRVPVTKGITFDQGPSLTGNQHPPLRMLKRFIDISCPSRVWIQTQRISIVVRLNEQPSEVSESHEAIEFSEAAPLWVQIDAPGFDLLSPAAQSIERLSEAVSSPVVFDLAPRQIGPRSVRFHFLQAGNPAGSTYVQIEITETETSTQSQEYTEALLHAATSVKPPDFMLFITCEPVSAPMTLRYKLLQSGDIVGQQFEPIVLVRPLQAYTQALYQRLTDLVATIDPTSAPIRRSEKSLGPQTIEDQLQEEGMNLWREFIPDGLKKQYEREREEWRNKSLLIISDEPDIPWELLWPYGETWKDPTPLCLQMNLARWLLRSPQEKVIYEPKPALDIQRMAAIVPPDTGLPGATQELSFLRTLMQEHHLQDVSPQPTYDQVKRFLQSEAFDWVHLATHGNFYPSDPDTESAIRLLDQPSLTTRTIVGEVEHAIRRQRSAFVFNACEVARLGWAINGLGGWASRLIGAGAGLFLAPLWPVRDGAAYDFITAMYQSLFSGSTIAEAVRQGRIEARREGDLTWLAYSLYAHPNAPLRDTSITDRGRTQ